ncbi:MAG: carotenoid biosynthesis protein [Candidatus Alcyoniella australis]|nr:carotenoid biosynthesis protein [Candidatus Alcyoniella australis]
MKIKDTLKKAWSHFPAWFVFIMGWGIINYEMARISPQMWGDHNRNLFALTVIFPMFWFLSYYTLAIRREGGAKQRRDLVLVWMLGIGAPLLTWLIPTYVYQRKGYLSGAEIVQVYEYSQFMWVAVLALHALRTRSFQRMLTFFAVCFVYGLLLENMGIILGYFSEHHYTIYIWLGDVKLPAPLSTQFGWCIMFYVALHLAEGFGKSFPALDRRPWALALLTSIIAVTLDMQIDPMASLSGVWWQWDSRLVPGFLGVPWLNFVAWFSAFLPLSFAYFFYRRSGLSEGRQNLRILAIVPWMPIACMAVGGVLMVVVDRGFNGPTFAIFNEFLHKLMPY